MYSAASPYSAGASSGQASFSGACSTEGASLRPVHLERLYDTVRSYLNSCSDREPLLSKEDIRDLTAEVVSSVWTKREELQYPTRYARRACRHRLIRFLELKRRRLRMRQEWLLQNESSSLSGNPELTAVSGYSVGVAEPRLAFVRKSLAGASGEVRLILHLRHDSGMSWAEIAEITGVTPSAARMRVLRFRKRVRQAWEREATAV